MVQFRRWFSRNLKTVVALGFGAGLLFGLMAGLALDSLPEGEAGNPAPPGPAFGLQFGVVAGATLGAETALYVWLIHRLMVKQWKRNFRRRARYQRSLDLLAPPDQAFACCLSAVRSVRHCTVQRADPGLGSIKARVGVSLWTFGEVIRISVRPQGSGLATAALLSRCAAPARTDWGKNRANVKRLIRFLEESGLRVVA